jgi:arylsulfatase A-like enzyme
MKIRDDPADSGAGLVYPPGHLGEILEIQREVMGTLPHEVGRFASFTAAEAPVFEAPLGRSLLAGEDQRIFFLKKAYLFDQMDGRVAEFEYPAIAPDLVMVHFQCIDFASHYFLYFNDPKRFASMAWSPEERAELEAQQRLYGGTVEAFYRYADEWLGRLVALGGPDTGVLLLSDHGFEPESDAHRTGNHLSAPPGIFVVAGPGVLPGRRNGGATLYDVMPTLAAVLGLPVADDLPGRPQASWFTPEAWRELAITRVAAYDTGGRYVPDIPAPDETEKELIEQLRSIGYVK